jgi:hypothetical protein
LKKGAKKVIRTIVAYEHEDDLKKTIDKDNPIVKEMMTNASAGYNKDHKQCKFDKGRYGNPEDFTGSEKPTKEKLINYLHDKKLNDIQKQSSA